MNIVPPPTTKPTDCAVDTNNQQPTVAWAEGRNPSRETALLFHLQQAHRRIAVLEHQTRWLQAVLAAHNNCQYRPYTAQQQQPIDTMTRTLRLLRDRFVSRLTRTISQMRFQDHPREVAIKEDNISMETFRALFAGHGILVQPTITNKPSSYVYIKNLTTQDALAVFGGKKDKNLEFVGEQWLMAQVSLTTDNEGVPEESQQKEQPSTKETDKLLEQAPAPTATGATRFARKSVPIQIISVKVTYSGKTKKLKVQFTVGIKTDQVVGNQ